MRTATCFLAAGLLLFGQDVRTDEDPAPPVLLHLAHFSMNKGARPTRLEDDLRRLSRRDHGTTEIALERVPGIMPTSPFLSVVLRSNGEVHVPGEPPAWHISTAEFGRLAWAILELGYEDLDPFYSRNMSTAVVPSVFTSIVRDGKRSIIRNDNNAGPARLWAVEQAIDSVVQSAFKRR